MGGSYIAGNYWLDYSPMYNNFQNTSFIKGLGGYIPLNDTKYASMLGVSTSSGINGDLYPLYDSRNVSDVYYK